jgi:acyl carrier protein
MSLFERIFGTSESERLLREQADLWAARHYPAAKRTIAATTARIVVEQQGVGMEQLSPTTRFIQDLQMHDPLEGVELVMAVEEEFGIKIPEKHSEAMATLGDLVTYLHERFQTHAA